MVAILDVESYKPREGTWASVAVVIRKCNGDLQVLVGRRRNRSNDPWAGDASFPGGHYKEEDGDLLRTAIRETMEETGIDLSGARIIKVLDIHHPKNVPEINVVPIIFMIDGCDVNPTKDGGEFDELRWINLSELPKYEAVTAVKGRERKAIIYDGIVIWGMTRRILCKVYEEFSLGGESSELNEMNK